MDVRTAAVDLVVRPRRAPAAAASGERSSSLRVEGLDVERVSVPGLPDGEARPGRSSLELAVPPMFFEQTDYAVAVRARGGGALSFRCGGAADACVGRPFEDDASRLSGVVNFGNDIGFSDMTVDLDGREVLRVRLEVYPGKISYKEDYLAMMDDLDALVRGCVLDFMRRTYRGFVPDCRRSDVPAVFFTVLRAVFGRYLRAVRRILASPHHALVPEREVVPSRRAARTDARSARWLERHPWCLRRDGDAILADRAPAVRRRTTYDTGENRLVRFILRSTVRLLGDFAGRYAGRGADAGVLAEAAAMRRELDRALTTGILAGVSEYDAARSMSLVFGMAPGYRELYRCHLMLRNGLALGGDVFRMSVKDTATLYEYWCFLKLYSILGESHELRSPDVVRVDRRGVSVVLAKGRRSRVTFANRRTGELIRLAYNPRESETPTVGQRPDNVLELEKVGSPTTYRYVFDAKYRIEANPAAPFYPDTMPGPKVEDVNTMHRYRDAIVCASSGRGLVLEKAMFGAYILFPYADEEAYARHRFYRSIDEVNIGGLPFLPSATSLVRRLLDELVADSPASASERAVLPAGVAGRLARADWTRRDVLIGLVADDAHLDMFLGGRMYFTGSFDRANLPVRTVALYEKGKGIRWHGEVVSWRTAARRTLPGAGAHGDALCHVFEVAGWRRLPAPVAAGEHGPNPVAYTTGFLLGVAGTYAELHIRDEAEYRLFTELRRLAGASAVGNGDGCTAFEAGGARAWLDGGLIRVLRDDGRTGSVDADEFMRRPGAAFRRLRRDMFADA